ncbi:hypothetical protein E2C01_067477 [Portunus trituberculatus]|uniref:Uncharacterized protein n=1 Tax=Portunus trituberculatus TaxID=210409 RepID=A0A5B7HTR1_PORTR|nr:hypothetical protein [Portunus trituberculatus]
MLAHEPTYDAKLNLSHETGMQDVKSRLHVQSLPLTDAKKPQCLGRADIFNHDELFLLSFEGGSK